jgi:uncharacterized protein (TIGR03083 family)
VDEDRAWSVLAAERRAFADVLDTLTPAQWQTPSLCGSWTVAGVCTHMMVGQTGSLWSFLTALVLARGRFGRANEIMVERKIDRPTSAVAADFREQAEHRFTPPGLDWRAPLTDFLIHRLDALVPLGLDHGRALEPWVPALDFAVSDRARGSFNTRGLPDLTYVASDVDWTHGEGDRVEGPAESLALAITRRPTARLGDLDGPGASTLRAWARS